MYTQCPQCLVIYKLGAATVVAARGRVRCGSCAAEFDSLATLADDLPPEPVHELGTNVVEHMPPLLSVPSLRPQTQQSALFEDIGEIVPVEATPKRRNSDLPTHSITPENTLRGQRPPSFAKKHASRASRGSGGWGWAVGAFVLLLMLGAQFAWAYRAQLLANADVHRVVERTCARLRCTIPAVGDPSRIALLARDIRPHPTVPGALVISATLSNQALFAQPYPTVQITMADPNEQRIAMRRFAPSEYVNEPSALARGLAAGASASFALEVADPGKNAVAFEFNFL